MTKLNIEIVNSAKKCYITGCVRNCGQHLPKVFENIKEIAELFDEYKVIVSYDESHDNTLTLLKQYQKTIPMEIIVNERPLSKVRAKNICDARNAIIDYIRKEDDDTYDYFIMMDFDDVCAIYMNTSNLETALERDDWDALSFYRYPYYDIWALSIEPYVFSCWHWGKTHFSESKPIVEKMEKYVTEKLESMNEDELLECQSAFNGFCIYRKDKFLNCKYDWDINRSRKLISEEAMKKNMKAVGKTKIEYIGEYDEEKFNKEPSSGIIKNFEDCEHRNFHMEAIQKNGARIRISPLLLFM